MKVKNKEFFGGILSALGCEILFGLSYLFTKQASHQASALALLGWRFLVAFLVMCCLVKLGLIAVDFRGKSWKQLVLIGLFSPLLYYIGETVGIGLTTASESGTFLATIPVVSLLASGLILKEKPSPSQIVGIFITLFGVLSTVFAVGASSSFSLSGYLMLSLAVLSYALYCVYVEKTSQYTGIEITFFMIGLGFLAFTSLALLEAVLNQNLAALVALPAKNLGFLSAILYQGIGCSILAFFLSNYAISKIGVNRTASFIGVSTLVSILSAILFLGESFTGLQALGLVFIVLGVYVANRG